MTHSADSDIGLNNGLPDGLAILRDEHAAIRLLFARLSALYGNDDDAEDKLDKAALTDELCEALRLHSELEEACLYPALQADTDNTLLADALLAHAGIADLAAQLEVMYPGDAHFDATFSVLSEETAQHMAIEESQLFTAALAAGLDVVALGQALTGRRAERALELAAATAPEAAPLHEGRRRPGRIPD